MRDLRTCSARGRIRPLLGLLLAGSCSMLCSKAFAQSTVGHPVNTATGRSLADAVSQNLNELIDQQVLTNQSAGAPSGGTGAQASGSAQLGGPRFNVNGPGAGGTAAVTGALSTGAVPTGRLRTSEHEALEPADRSRFNYSTNEASAFANAVVPMQGTVLGGQLKLAGVVGFNRVSLDLKSNVRNVLDPNQFANGSNESLLAGASALWASQGMYVVGSVTGFRGETKLVDSVDDCNDTGCAIHRYKFNTSGFIATGSVGHVFDLAGASGPKLDLRGTLGYIRSNSDPFTNVNILSNPSSDNGVEQRYTFSTWTGTAGATLFTNVVQQNGSLLRPYIQAQIRQEWNYRSQLHVTNPDGTFRGTFSTNQAHTYGGLSAGVTYRLDNLTLGAAAYTEYSSDERTLGGRLGATWELGGEAPQRGSSKPSAAAPASWSGFYLGVNAGYTWADVAMTNLGPPADFFALVGAGDTVSPRGWLGGGQVGYNWQVGSIVVGVEGARNVVSLKDEKVGTVIGGFEKDHWSSNVSQIYGITGRFGLTAGSWLPYVKGGFAGASIETSMTRPADPNFVSASENWHNGWTIGGGVEYMLAPNWTLGIGYDHYKFETKTVSAIRAGDPTPGVGGGVVDNWTVKPDNIQTITARMNFKFD